MQRHLYLRVFAALWVSALLTLNGRCENADALEKAAENAETLMEYISLDKIIQTLTFNISSCFKALISGFGICACVVLVASVFSAFRDNFSSYATSFDVVSGCIVVASSYSVLITSFETVEKSIVSVCGYMTSFVPVSAALLASSGNTVTAGSGAVVNSFFISTVQLISVSLVLPCVKAIVVLCGINALCKKTNLSGISNFLKSTCLWITGLSFTIFTGFLSLQTLLSSGADNLAMKGIKYSAARLVPIAGGMLSESMKTVIASMNYIKTVTGIGGIIFIVYTMLLPVCAIVASKLFFLGLSALSKATNQDSFASLFDGMNSSVNILSAILLGSAVSFIIMLAMFIKVTVSL